MWRVGRKLGRTLYRDDVCVGMVDTRELAEEMVRSLNLFEAALAKPAPAAAPRFAPCPNCGVRHGQFVACKPVEPAAASEPRSEAAECTCVDSRPMTQFRCPVHGKPGAR